ncbi:DUF4249 domain-containing protein [Flavobacterium sp.]|uniref:DUF4249 domain-containing protein n=1 Tax=Flavobacterium sp. TaxID=239 RepID=UPI0026338F7D|nr:DUF4249 domain-containing protein [Flavobacterium sp.]MDD3003920.1 DUF4249 domain-containing protein [Flavobacterium sp.]
MKKYIYTLLIVIGALNFVSCEEVIDVKLDTAAPRLVIDAALKWEKGTDGKTQKIKLSTTTGYFNTEIPKVSGATVFVTNSQNEMFNFTETVANSGEYICTDFDPELNENYTLTVVLNGVTYTASDKLIPVPSIDKIEQKDDGGFGGQNIEIKFFYTDNGSTDDFYLFKTKLSSYTIPQYGVSNDTFYQGNQFYTIYSNEDLKSGKTIDFTLSGISENYFNYMQILLSIAGNSGGGPFQSPPATVRGNIINQTDVKNYALGYFSASETTSITYVIN